MLGEVPVLDVRDYVAGKPGALEALSEQLVWASENVGFYFLRCPGSVAGQIAATLDMDRKLHALPEEALRAIEMDQSCGYQFGNNYGADVDESVGGGDARGDERVVTEEYERGGRREYNKDAYGGQGTYRIWAALLGHGEPGR